MCSNSSVLLCTIVVPGGELGPRISPETGCAASLVQNFLDSVLVTHAVPPILWAFDAPAPLWDAEPRGL